MSAVSIPIRPSTFDLEPHLDNVPLALRSRPQWVVWRYEINADRNKWTKVPYRSDDPESHASTTEPETWSTFEAAVARYNRRKSWSTVGKLDGIGFVFAADDPFTGIDLDNCLDEDRHPLPWAEPYLNSLTTYAEISPSGRGVKLVAIGALPSIGRKKTGVGPDGGAVEMYDRGRYFTITGIRLESHPQDPADVEAALLAAHAKLWPEKPGQRALVVHSPIAFTDEEMLQKAFASASGPKVKALYAGDLTGHGGDESSADMALCCHLAFWLGRDRAAVDRVFRSSGLMRQKWDSKRGAATYGELTIRRALEWATDHYKPLVDVSLVVAGRRVHLGRAVANEAAKEGDAAPQVDFPPEEITDPYRLARVYQEQHVGRDGCLALSHWRDEWHQWDGRKHRVVPDAEIKADLTQVCKAEFDMAATVTGKPAVAVTRTMINNVAGCLAALCMVKTSDVPYQPAWIKPPPDAPPPHEILPAANGLIHLPSFFAGKPYRIEPTAKFFSPTNLDYDFLPDSPRPNHWLDFLESLWGDDVESIRSLQEWFGYLLTSDTSQQKMLFMIGPPRSGKGTIARVLAELVGPFNVVNPTLSSLASEFRVAPMIGKTVALFSDARLTGRNDVAVIVERLLSITGEDYQTIDRKNKDSWSGKLATRFVLMANELPHLADQSRAIISRTVILRLTKSFVGHEDRGLQAKLSAEMPSILLWAMGGWHRLHDRGYFTQAASGQTLLDELAELSSPVGMFVADRCVVGPQYTVKVTEIYKAWVDWCAQNGRDHPGPANTFSRNLRSVNPTLDTIQMRDGGGRCRAFQGIAVNPDYL